LFIPDPDPQHWINYFYVEGKSIYELQDEQLQLPQPLKPGTVPTSQQASDFLATRLDLIHVDET
jgi:hypothetical protein